MKVIILAGGMGVRMREETEYRPKPMVFVGSRPILWHIMKSYMYYGFEGFCQCMETVKDAKYLNDLWNAGKAPWKVWK
jgi:glucose-1-phosphate cytidylyltransferase